MGSALLEGALNAKLLSPGQIVAFDLDRHRLSRLNRKFGICAAKSGAQAVSKADFIFLCVKPQQMKNLILEIRESVVAKQCLVSIAAGISTRTLENCFSIRVPVIRAMPNTPALIQSGMTAITKGRFARRNHLQFAANFFSSVGEIVELSENLFDAVTAVSGSGPAYLFYLAESLERAGKKLGFQKDVIQILSRQTLLGAAKMLQNSSSPPRELRQKVTSPGGTTESAIRYLESKKWATIFEQAIQKARNRSKKLGKSIHQTMTT